MGVGGVGPCKGKKEKKKIPEDGCLKLLRQMRHSAARHEGNDLVNVTFISLSTGSAFTIVVCFVQASETYIISPFMYKLTWQSILKAITLPASLLKQQCTVRRSRSLSVWRRDALICRVGDDLKSNYHPHLSVGVLIKAKTPTFMAMSVINEYAAIIYLT